MVIELSHFRRFYESLFRKFLTEEEYLRRFKPKTLENIIRKCYLVWNENKITNHLYEWQRQFHYAWDNIKDLPTAAYDTDYVHKINYNFYSETELNKIPEKYCEIFGNEIKEINQEVVIIEDICEYFLISPYEKPFDFHLINEDILEPFKNKHIDNEKSLVYQLEIDNNPIELKIGDDKDYSVDISEDQLSFKLHHIIKAKPRTHILLKAFSIEPTVDDFYNYFQQKQVLDGHKVYFTSNKKLQKLNHQSWYPNMDYNKKKVIEETNHTIIYKYEDWVFPGAGFSIVWQR